MIKVYVSSSDFGNCVDIAIIDEKPDGTIFLAKPVELVFEKLESPWERWNPTLSLGRRRSEEFLHSLAEALDKQNIKTDKDAKFQGTIEATRYHLEDLRKLLKLKS